MNKENIIRVGTFQFRDNSKGEKEFKINSKFISWMQRNAPEYETATALAEGFFVEFEVKVFNSEGLEEDNPDIPEWIFEMSMKYKPED